MKPEGHLQDFLCAKFVNFLFFVNEKSITLSYLVTLGGDLVSLINLYLPAQTHEENDQAESPLYASMEKEYGYTWHQMPLLKSGVIEEHKLISHIFCCSYLLCGIISDLSSPVFYRIL